MFYAVRSRHNVTFGSILARSLGPVLETKSNKGLGIELKRFRILDPDEVDFAN